MFSQDYKPDMNSSSENWKFPWKTGHSRGKPDIPVENWTFRWKTGHSGGKLEIPVKNLVENRREITVENRRFRWKTWHPGGKLDVGGTLPSTPSLPPSLPAPAQLSVSRLAAGWFTRSGRGSEEAGGMTPSRDGSDNAAVDSCSHTALYVARGRRAWMGTERSAPSAGQLLSTERERKKTAQVTVRGSELLPQKKNQEVNRKKNSYMS